MEILKEKYSITELSQMLNVTDHALRYYEKEFKFAIPKDDRGRRYYTAEFANIMYQIKAMRDDGLEIKAIRNILQSQNVIRDAEISDENPEVSILPAAFKPDSSNSLASLEAYFNEFRERLTTELSTEINSSRDHLLREMTKSKLELGACVENGFRKVEAKMEKHFEDVDKALGNWRQKQNKKKFLKFL